MELYVDDPNSNISRLICLRTVYGDIVFHWYWDFNKYFSAPSVLGFVKSVWSDGMHFRKRNSWQLTLQFCLRYLHERDFCLRVYTCRVESSQRMVVNDLIYLVYISIFDGFAERFISFAASQVCGRYRGQAFTEYDEVIFRVFVLLVTNSTKSRNENSFQTGNIFRRGRYERTKLHNIWATLNVVEWH